MAYSEYDAGPGIGAVGVGLCMIKPVSTIILFGLLVSIGQEALAIATKVIK